MKKIELENTIRILVIAISVVTSYLVILSIIQAISHEPKTMMEMMTGYQNSYATAMSAIIALFIGLLIGLMTKSKNYEKIVLKYDKKKALNIVKKKLSEDEKNLLREVEKSGKITQDSLRARLGWSKAKVSTTITRLDKMGLIQKRRIGKTYDIFLSKDLESV